MSRYRFVDTPLNLDKAVNDELPIRDDAQVDALPHITDSEERSSAKDVKR